MEKNTSKIYTASKEIGGVTYRAQFNGVRECLRAIDTYKNDTVKFHEYLLGNVIVEPPGLKIDDFDTLEEERLVTSFAADVMSGRFRGTEEPGADPENGRKQLASVEAGAE